MLEILSVPPGAPYAPKLSVILVVRNGAATVARSAESVAAQRYPNLEFIVWDGLSTDGTLDMLKPFAPLITLLRSERDSGHPDGASKAALLATGDYVGFLSADDVYEPGALWAVADALAHEPGAGLVSFGAVHRVRDRTGAYRVVGYYARREQLELTLENVFSGLPTFVLSRFYRRDLLLSHLPFTSDPDSWCYANDREFVARLALAKPENAIIDKALYGFEVNPQGVSGNPANLDRLISDHLMITEAFLARTDLTRDQRRVTAAWRLNQCALGFWRALAREDFKRAKWFFKQGIQQSWRMVPVAVELLVRKTIWRVGLALSRGIDAG